jgi:hypothetical protein
MRPLHILIPLSFILNSGCGNEGGAELDGINDDLASGDKADIGTLAENTPDAYAVLQVANRADVDTLFWKVQLGAAAAEAIVAVRDGDDGILNTRDDSRFTTLRALDQVPWVGPRAFEHLRDWGKANGYGMPDLHGDYLISMRPYVGADLTFFYLGSRMQPSGRFADEVALWEDQEATATSVTSHADSDAVKLEFSWKEPITGITLRRVKLDGKIRSGDLLCGSGTLTDASGDTTRMAWGASRWKDRSQAPVDPIDLCR